MVVGGGHLCIKGKFPQAGGDGGYNRTFAFGGRILVPAAVFLAFFGGFLHVFLMDCCSKSSKKKSTGL